jgi:hypothetical protein
MAGRKTAKTVNTTKLAVGTAAAPVTTQAKIADPASGGTVDTQARTAINAIIDALEAFGITSTT